MISGGSEGEGQGENRTQQLVNAHALFPEKPGESDAVKEADKSGYDSCGGENKSSHNQRMTMSCLKTGWLYIVHGLCSLVFDYYIPPGRLTEQYSP